MGSSDNSSKRGHLKIATSRWYKGGVHGWCDVLLFHSLHRPLGRLSHLFYSFDLWSLQRKPLVSLTLDSHNIFVLASLPRWLLFVNALIWWTNTNHTIASYCYRGNRDWVLLVAVHCISIPNPWLWWMETWKWELRLGNETKIFNQLQFCTNSWLDAAAAQEFLWFVWCIVMVYYDVLLLYYFWWAMRLFFIKWSTMNKLAKMKNSSFSF